VRWKPSSSLTPGPEAVVVEVVVAVTGLPAEGQVGVAGLVERDVLDGVEDAALAERLAGEVVVVFLPPLHDEAASAGRAVPARGRGRGPEAKPPAITAAARGYDASAAAANGSGVHV
jgi:hypothetical protein